MSGNATLISLLLILLVTTAALGVALIAGTETALVWDLERNTAELASLSGAADRTGALLSQLKANEPDSLLDPLYKEIEVLAAETGTVITLTDLSSRFNLNSIRKNMIEGTAIRNFLQPGISAGGFQQYREDEGFALNIAGYYGGYFEKEFIERYASGWGYWNINTSDEFTLVMIFAIRTGDDAAAGAFHNRIREQLKNRTLIASEDLEQFLGIRYCDQVFPAVNAEPPVNINTADEWVVKQLLGYAAFRVVSPSAVAESLFALRRSGPIRGEALYDLVPVSEKNAKGELVLPRDENRLFAWLGDTTWFWEIRVERDGRALRRVLARLPEESSSGSGIRRRYRIVSEVLPW